MSVNNQMTALADSIRAKSGTSGLLGLDTMKGAVDSIVTPQKLTWQQTPTAVQTYLDYVAAHPYTSDYTTSYFDAHTPTRDDKPVQIGVMLPGGELIVTDNYNAHSYKKQITNGTQMLGSFPPEGASYVVESSGEVVAVGSLTPTGSRRFIQGTPTSTPAGITGSLNMRDLGGLPCDGGTVKYGMLIRGGEVYPADTELQRILYDEIGIRAELELLGEESGTRPDWDVDYCCPVDGEPYWAYYTNIFSHTENIKKAFSFIFESAKNGKPLYFHCQQGADRTGTIALFIEALLGVPQNICDVDYELTSFSNSAINPAIRKRNGREYSPGSWEYGYRDTVARINAMTVGSTFRDKIVNYFASLGFTAEEINGFRAAVIDGYDPQEDDVTPVIGSYTVTKNATHTSVTGGSTATQYQSYEAEVKSASGYVISNISVTMGGADITGSVFSGQNANLFYSVENTLSHCTTNNTKIAVIAGQGYGATLTADSDYTLSGGTITITMGGANVSQYYSNGKIAIPNVTGNIVITVTAVPSALPYTNLADPQSADWLPDHRLSSSGIEARTGKTVSNPVSLTVGDVIRVKGVNFETNVDRIGLFGKNVADVETNYLAYVSSLSTDGFVDYSFNNGVHTFTFLKWHTSVQKDASIRFAFSTPGDTSTVIITKNEEIE